MKFESIHITNIENGYLVDIHLPDPKAKERWDTIDREYFCGSEEEVIKRITNAFQDQKR